uniref:Polymerase/primase n=1 Tax=Dulem virus 42 TaxID=3145760 RepID=A0AAU8BA84_9CAUD
MLTIKFQTMYSTKNATYGILQDLISQLTDYDIFSYYMGDFIVGKLYNSPLRHDDKIPSFAVFKGRQGNLMFKDHGSGISGNAITFIKEYKHISSNSELEKELLRIIKTTAPKSTRTSTKEYKSYSTTDIGVVRQDFTDIDKQYWGKYNISISTLQKFDVFSIKYFLCNKIVSGIYKDEQPMYAYKVNDKFKIYRPLNSKYTKWRTNLTTSDIQGYKQLPENGNLLIITKSLKDVMVLYELGYSAISPSSETSFIPDDILISLQDRFKHILILFDRDKAGMKKAREFSKKYKLDAFFVNKKFAAKDISDAIDRNDTETVKQWLSNTLQKYEN